MIIKRHKRLFFTLLSVIFTNTMAQAQNQQPFLPNVESGIVNDINSGAVNSSQAQQLQNRANAIQSQELKDMSQNNGTLTAQEQRQINRESEGLNRSAHQDVRTNNPNANFNSNWRSQYQQPGYNNPNNPNWQQWNQNNQNNPNNQQANQNGNQYRRHSRWSMNNFFNR